MIAQIGDRVMATIGGTGTPRPGRVTMVMRNGMVAAPWLPETTYMVHFNEHRNGSSGPCIVHRVLDRAA